MPSLQPRQYPFLQSTTISAFLAELDEIQSLFHDGIITNGERHRLLIAQTSAFLSFLKSQSRQIKPGY